jgi:hypothetical protein
MVQLFKGNSMVQLLMRGLPSNAYIAYRPHESECQQLARGGDSGDLQKR